MRQMRKTDTENKRRKLPESAASFSYIIGEKKNPPEKGRWKNK